VNDRYISDIDVLQAQLDHAREWLRSVQYQKHETHLGDKYRDKQIADARAEVLALEFQMGRMKAK